MIKYINLNKMMKNRVYAEIKAESGETDAEL